MRIRRLTRLAWALIATGGTLIAAGVVVDRWWLGAAGLAAVLGAGVVTTTVLTLIGEDDTGSDEYEVRITAEDADRRREWAAAYRTAADTLDTLILTSAAAALRDLADAIERGELTPWTDSPEPATAPADVDATAPTGPGASTDTRDAQAGSQAAQRVIAAAAALVHGWRSGAAVDGRALTAAVDALQADAEVQQGDPGWVADDIEAIESLLGDSGHLELIPTLRAVVAAARDRDRLERERDALFARGERYRAGLERARPVVEEAEAVIAWARDEQPDLLRHMTALAAAVDQHQQEATDA